MRFGLVFVFLFGIGNLDFEPGYFFHLAKGQLQLLWRAKPISRVLKDENLDSELRAGLHLVEEIRAFARDRIGLATSRNYTTFVDIGAGPVSWNLVVCAKDRLTPETWHYPVVGTVPYRGYFVREEAIAARDAYADQGFDTYLRPVSAYSTLGWFPDPILSTMLRYDEADLADLLIHELTHATIWIDGDVTFNESLASFVGREGALLWLREKYGTDAPVVQHVIDERADAQVFRKFMHGIATQLDSVYQTELPLDEKLSKREEIFSQAKQHYIDLPLRTDRYDGFPTWELNNALLALYRVYQGQSDVFNRVFEHLNEDLVQTLEVLKACEYQDDPEGYLQDWLATQ